MWYKVPCILTPRCFLIWYLAHWWALWRMLLWDKLTRFFKPTLPNLAYSILPLSISSANTLWWMNLKWSSPLSLMQYLTIPKKVYEPSSLNFFARHNMTCHRILMPSQSHLNIFVPHGQAAKIPLDNLLETFWVKAPPCSTEHNPNNTTLLHKEPQIYNKWNISINSTHCNCNGRLKILEIGTSTLLCLRSAICMFLCYMPANWADYLAFLAAHHNRSFLVPHKPNLGFPPPSSRSPKSTRHGQVPFYFTMYNSNPPPLANARAPWIRMSNVILISHIIWRGCPSFRAIYQKVGQSTTIDFQLGSQHLGVSMTNGLGPTIAHISKLERMFQLQLTRDKFPTINTWSRQVKT